MLEENEYSSGISPIANTSYGSNSIILGFNIVNTLDRCIVLSVSEEGEPNTLEFRDNGDILVHGKLIENDKQIVEGMREFLEKILIRI